MCGGETAPTVDDMSHPSASPPTASLVTLWTMRAASLLHAVLLVAQPVLAGRFLDGDYPALAQHGLVGATLMGSAGLLWLAAIVLLWPGRLGWWPLVLCTAMTAIMPIQVGMGHARFLAVHLSLGVVLVASGLALAVWAWWPGRARRSLRRPRAGRAVLPPGRPVETMPAAR